MFNCNYNKAQQKANQLLTNKPYIQQLIADMFDSERNGRDITPADVARLKQRITLSYLTNIVLAEEADEILMSTEFVGLH